MFVSEAGAFASRWIDDVPINSFHRMIHDDFLMHAVNIRLYSR